MYHTATLKSQSSPSDVCSFAHFDIHKSNAVKYHALSYLFLKDMEIKSSKYWTRHRKVRAILLQLLREDESRLVYVRDYLKYGSCGCLTRVIQV